MQSRKHSEFKRRPTVAPDAIYARSAPPNRSAIAWTTAAWS
jgi:hypothetical protein